MMEIISLAVIRQEQPLYSVHDRLPDKVNRDPDQTN